MRSPSTIPNGTSNPNPKGEMVREPIPESTTAAALCRLALPGADCGDDSAAKFWQMATAMPGTLTSNHARGKTPRVSIHEGGQLSLPFG